MITKKFMAIIVGLTFCAFAYATESNTYIVLNNKKSFEKQVIYKNTTYEIKDTYEIDTNFRIPENCLLVFRGGMITGKGVLEGNGTRIEAVSTRIFGDNLTVQGVWSVERAYCEWFGGSSVNRDNSTAIQKCIDAFNMLTLMPTIYHIEKTLDISKDGCLISGVSKEKSEIRKTYSISENLNAVFNISKTRDRNIQYITMRDLRLSASSFNVDYGIYTDGINSSEFRNLNIFQCKNGFYCKNETHGALWNLIFENIEFNCNTLRVFEGVNHYGYKERESSGVTCVTNGGASVQFNKCWVRDCATGFHLKGLGYSQLNMCAADNIQGTAYFIEFCGLSMVQCGMENLITKTAVHLYQSKTTMIGFCDYKIYVNSKDEAHRIKIDGGTASLINCYLVEWEYNSSKVALFGVTCNYGAKVIMNNTAQPKNIIRKYDALNGASIKYIE